MITGSRASGTTLSMKTCWYTSFKHSLVLLLVLSSVCVHLKPCWWVASCVGVYVCVYARMRVCVCVCVSACLSAYLSVYLSICLSFYQSVCLPACRCVCTQRHWSVTNVQSGQEPKHALSLQVSFLQKETCEECEDADVCLRVQSAKIACLIFAGFFRKWAL